MRRNVMPLTGHRLQPRNVGTQTPFGALQHEMNRLFDDVWQDFGVPAAGMDAGIGAPRVDVSEDDKNVFVTAELPGLKEDDVDVTFDDGMLTIAGEKKSKTEDKGRQYIISERTYGRFERTLPIGREVDEDKIDASFSDGILTITLPKTEQGQHTRKISVKRAA